MTIVEYPFRAIALASLLLIAGFAGPAGAQQRVGVDSAVNPVATSIPPGGAPRRLVLGQEVVFNEHITTGAGGQTQILFVDGSSLTIGPTADMVIDEFVYDPNAGTGKLAASLSRGIFRFVGGTLSKRENAVTMQTPSATIGVRGGVMLVNLLPSGRLEVIFGYGKGLTVTGRNGVSETITRPGFEVTVSGPGASPSAPAPAPDAVTEALLAQLDGRSGGNGGARTIPTEAMVANSGIANVISSDIAASRRAAAQTRPPARQPPSASAAVQQSEWNIQNVAYQGATVTPVNGGPPVRLVNFDKNPAGAPGSAVGVGGGGVVIRYAGLIKATSDPIAGFIDQTGTGRIPYVNGILSFPQGSPQNGIFSLALSSSSTLSFPLVPGVASFGPANTLSPVGALTGTSFLSPDMTFFYADLQAPGFPNGRGFIFGGQPVDPSFYAQTGNARIFAFDVQPDAALQSPIPFITNNTGGNISNPSISPYYVVAPANSAFGAFNPISNLNAIPTRSLQASLAISGQGANQSSVLVVNTGIFGVSSDTAKVIGSGTVRGSFLANGTATPIGFNSSSATVPSGLNDNLFGSNAISGFVVDQNAYNTNLNFQQQLASYFPYADCCTTNYAFTHPVTATALPSGIGVSRTTQNLTGFFGGIMYPRIPGNGFPSPYAVTGTSVIQTDATSNQVAATFSGNNPFGANSLTLRFGSLSSGSLPSSTFIDDKNFAAVENPTTPSQVNGVNIQLNGDPTQVSSIAMVTAATVPSNSLLPNGLCSQCQFLQWGYWTGELGSPNAAGTGVIRQDRAHINTWIAGIPSVTLPTSGVGTFTGNAFGSVVSGAASYLASGQFSNSWNFGTRSGAFALSNFDGRNYSGTVATPPGTFGSYNGSLAGPSGFSGRANGMFFGPMAPETGGNFALQGPAYLASGIFAGKR
jgi:trimeric autotransporter adhesin